MFGVYPESGLLAEWRLGRKAPFGGAVLRRADPGEYPAVERLEEVMVMAQESQIVELSRTIFGEGNHMVYL
jgi:hypothetical protein